IILWLLIVVFSQPSVSVHRFQCITSTIPVRERRLNKCSVRRTSGRRPRRSVGACTGKRRAKRRCLHRKAEGEASVLAPESGGRSVGACTGKRRAKRRCLHRKAEGEASVLAPESGA